MDEENAVTTSRTQRGAHDRERESSLHQKLGYLRWQGRFQVERARQQIKQYLHNTRGLSRPVFLLGCGRSGTSMVVRQLDQSWQIKLYNEDHAEAFDNYRLRDLHTVESLVARSRAPVTLFKPILNTCQARALLTRFPQAQILFVFRHYDDVINSSLRRFGRENRFNHALNWIKDDFSEFVFAPPPVQTRAYIRSRWRESLTAEEGAALYWLFYNRLFFDLKLVEEERVYLLHYETLVTDPASGFRSLAQFLKVEFERKMNDGVLSTSIRRHRPPLLSDDLRVDCDKLYARLLSVTGTVTSQSPSFVRHRLAETGG